MREQSIIFNSEMVKAILDGRKTMTRRPIKLRTSVNPHSSLSEQGKIYSIGDMQRETELTKNTKPNYPCPYGQQGDRLWVREKWGLIDLESGYAYDGLIPPKFAREEYEVAYYADWSDFIDSLFHKWRDALYMPKWTHRITLEITEVRVERLQEITEEDVISEGTPNHPGQFREGNMEAFVRFAYVWNSLYTKKSEYQWEANPWVWVIEFRPLPVLLK